MATVVLPFNRNYHRTVADQKKNNNKKKEKKNQIEFRE